MLAVERLGRWLTVLAVDRLGQWVTMLAVKRLGRRWIVDGLLIMPQCEVFVDCLQLAKEDQATCRPMVNNRSLQTNNNRFRPEATIDDLVSTVRPHSVIVPNIN
jgi:hypothetical protein